MDYVMKSLGFFSLSLSFYAAHTYGVQEKRGSMMTTV
jgi:hypothetical protein